MSPERVAEIVEREARKHQRTDALHLGEICEVRYES